MLLGQRSQIPIIPGVNPIEDSTALDTIFFTDADKVRFQNLKLRKLKGWQRIFPSDGLAITGYVRNIYSYRNAKNDPVTVFGTSTRLYAYIPTVGNYFYNITPLSTDTTNIQNAFTTEYHTPVNVDIITVSNSPVITMNIDNYFANNDEIEISGVTGGPFNGIPANAFNGTFTVLSLSNTQIQFTVSSNASSSGTTTLNGITWASTYLYVNVPDHGVQLGDRVGILLSDPVGGIPAASINIEHIIIQIVDGNTIVIDTDTFATSLVTGGGGTATTIQMQIPAGNDSQNSGDGFGSAEFGQGLFGVSTPDGGVSYPRIWSMDAYGTTLVLTPGDGAPDTANLYTWDNDITVAPTILSAAPKNVKWTYVSNNIVVALGAVTVLNSFTGSDTANSNEWTPGPATYAYTTNILQASALISQARTRNYDLLFTQADVYRVQFIDKPDIWYFEQLFATDGIIGPKARAIVQDAVFWQGQGDFYVFDGNTVNPLPNNTLKRYVSDNINMGQSYKCFAYANTDYNEVWFFFCFGQDIEPNDYVIYNYKEQHWTNGTLSRTAAEEYVNVNGNPVLIQSAVIETFPIPNSLSSYFFSLPTNTLSTAMGTGLVTTSFFPNCYLEIGDKIKISGAAAVGGITTGQLNKVQTLTNVTYGTLPPTDNVVAIAFDTGGTATSDATGGGANTKIATSILGVNYSRANSLAVGETITISGASSVDGFTVAQVNSTAVIRKIVGTTLETQISTPSVYSTSAVTAAGGIEAAIVLPVQSYLFQHETGFNDYNMNFRIYSDPWENQFAPMNSYVITNYAQIQEGDNTMLIYSLYPDIRMEGNMTITVNVKEFAQSGDIHTQTFPITPTTTKIDPMMIGRVRQYQFTSNVLNGNFLMGHMTEEVLPSTPR